MHYILEGREPKKVGLMEWASWYETADRKIARDEVGGILVSTVFLGLDHRYGEGEPLIYETMIFGGEHSEYQERYSTYEEAEKGHERACKLAGLK